MTALDQGRHQTAAAFMRQALAQTEKYGNAELLDYQRNHLKHLLRFAKAQVPFYEERLAPLFHKDGTVDLSRWHDIPILTRADIKNNGQAMLVKELPKGHGRVHAKASSGTTGTPITVHFSTLMSASGTAAFERACRWYGRVDGDRFCMAFSDSNLKSLDRRSWSIAGDDGATGPSAEHLAVGINWPPERILALMEKHGSTCFSSLASILEVLSATQLERRANIPLKFLVGTSMALTERARALARQAFYASAYSAYSSTEGHMMANECPISGGFHVNSEIVKLEILDNAGNPCAFGEAGRVIVTPLLNTAQPLIRYEQGDLATWGEPCPCGRAHPLIARIDGRVRDLFRFATGRKFTPAIGFEPYRDLLKADRWQVAQTGPLDIEVRFISSEPDEAIDFAGLTQVYRKAFHRDLNVTYRRVETMPLTAAGKFIDYVNEYEA